MSFRIFVAGAETSILDAPPGLEEAYDLMRADKVPGERIHQLLVACLKSGRDPLEFAKHFVKVRREYRAAVS